MAALNWGLIQDGGTFESLTHALLLAQDSSIILFGRPGKDSGQDARSGDGRIVYQAKYRQGLTMDGAVGLALDELEAIRKYRQSSHSNYRHWQQAQQWILVANITTNPNDNAKWRDKVEPAFLQEGLTAEYWGLETLESLLVSHPNISDVFFGGENRVLVGMKEAYDLLHNEFVGSNSLDHQMVGRDKELRAITDFLQSQEQRLLPVVGPGGIGKSRLIYESLIAMASNGWQVYWGLPGSMARSSRWFRLINSSQPICIAIDDPDDTGLLRSVIEQLATIERRNWKVIVVSRTERANQFPWPTHNKIVAETLELKPLQEADAKQLIQDNLTRQVTESWLYTVVKYTHGIPGWMCLIVDLVNRGEFAKLPDTTDALATTYVESCLRALQDDEKQSAGILLRWLALWGTLSLESEDTQSVIRFFDQEGLPPSMVGALLHKLVVAGLVRNWGQGKRLYAVAPQIIGEYLLSRWLLHPYNGKYQVSAEGQKLIIRIARGEIPKTEKVLDTLSSLTLSRLDTHHRFTFLGPLFDNLEMLAKGGTTVDQYQIVSLIEKIGAGDSERALDVLRTIRENPKDEEVVEDSFWGSWTFTHAKVLSKIPWTIFQIAENVQSATVAHLYLNEFQELIKIEDTGEEQFERGKKPSELLKRLLRRPENVNIFATPAQEIVKKELFNVASSSFIKLIFASLISPEREIIENTAKWTISISTRSIVPGNITWDNVMGMRNQAFQLLETATDIMLRCELWRLLGESHHEFSRMILHGTVNGAIATAYRNVLVSDLTKCAKILQASLDTPSVTETTAARAMWSWYLQYGRDDDPKEEASLCEDIYNNFSSVSGWNLSIFFRFDVENKLSPEVLNVINILKEASDVSLYQKFFDEIREYLAADKGIHDSGHISKLAQAVAHQFDPIELDTQSILTSFVLSILGQEEINNLHAWRFAVEIGFVA